MKSSLKILTLFTFVLSFGASNLAQDIECVRYQVIPNGMFSIIERHPEKKESIERKIKEDLMQYIDFIKLNDEIIQIIWSYDNSLMSLKVYSREEAFIINHNYEFIKEKYADFSDSVTYSKIEQKADSLFQYEIFEENAMPLTISLKNRLTQDQYKISSAINDHPELSFILDFNIFPEQFIFGKPKAFMTFQKIEEFKHCPIQTVNEFQEITNSSNSKATRKVIFKLISKRKQTSQP